MITNDYYIKSLKKKKTLIVSSFFGGQSSWNG
jgi:hypothetical protein